MATRPRAGMPALVLAASVCLLAGCSGGGSGSGTTTMGPTVPAPAAPTTSSSVVASGPVAVCTTAQLAVTIGTGGAGAGTFSAPFVVTDTGAPCSLTGYFGLALLNANGRPLGPSPRRDAGIVESSAPAGTEVVHGATTAVFGFQWPYSAADSASCPMATTVELTAPGQTDHISIPARTAAGQAIVPCGDGQSSIGPITASS